MRYKCKFGWTRIFFSERKAHAPLAAGAEGDHGFGVVVGRTHVNKAAGRGCMSRLVGECNARGSMRLTVGNVDKAMPHRKQQSIGRRIGAKNRRNPSTLYTPETLRRLNTTRALKPSRRLNGESNMAWTAVVFIFAPTYSTSTTRSGGGSGIRSWGSCYDKTSQTQRLLVVG